MTHPCPNEPSVVEPSAQLDEATSLLTSAPPSTDQNGDYEGIVVPAEDVRIQGRVAYVIHPPAR